MSTSLSELVDNTSGFFNSIECKSCIEKIEINSECCFVGLKNNKLIYKCKECKEEWKRPLNKLIESFPSIYQFCNGNLNKFVMLLRKGVYPYEYMNSWEKFDETALPPKEAFYSNLNLEDISDEDYTHAQKVWDVFEINNIGDYHDLYVQSDTLLLADVYENFRNMCFEKYQLDPTYFVPAPGLSWQACLKNIGVKLELITDYDMLLMTEKGKSKFNEDFIKNYDENSIKGYFVEVDTDYLKELFNLHKALPFLPERKKVEKVEKSICCTENKQKYVININTLKQALNHGLKLKKVHREIQFKHKAWLKIYIDMNTDLRKDAKNEFEKKFFKLMNISVFGKTMENVRNHKNIKLVTSDKRRKRLVSEPNYHSHKKFSDHLMAIEMKKTRVKMTKPLYLGMSILDISKILMYKFWYDYINPKYGDKAKLCNTDTDSFIITIKTRFF